MNEDSLELVLSSTSKYRAELLKKLGLPFQQVDPRYEEIAETRETPAKKAARLALGKALSAQNNSPTEVQTLYIGSDQVAECNGQILSKPGGFDVALKQLSHCSGQWTSFHTAVSLVNQDGLEVDSFIDEYRLKFRQLDKAIISRYLKREEPYDCAGSIKAEGHGIVLIEETWGLDVNTLYGLPLIKLTTALSKLGLI